MLYEYALISVVIASGYWGYYFLRHRPNGTTTFGSMQIGAALLAGLGLLGRKFDEPMLGIAGAVGLGAGVCLLVLGPIVRGLARRFAASERLGIAARLLDVAELLAPGSGVAEEKALLGAMKDIRAGKIEQTVEALIAAKQRAPADAQLAIDERIAMLYLAAYRWTDAIAYVREHGLVSDAAPETHREGVLLPLRDALGIAPPVWVELLGAYARTGDLDQAAYMMARLEAVCAGRPDSAVWIHRARMMFLALAGRPASVKTLLAPKRARHMSPAARTYWMAVALEHGGDRDAAATQYARARQKSRGRPRELIDEALARLPDAKPIELSAETAQIVELVESAAPPAPIQIERHYGPWATWSLTAALVGVAIAIAVLVGPSTDLGVLVRSGAMVRGRIDDGEWWRLVSSIFVHVGMVHLVVNAIGLYFLGRTTEELFGSTRTLAIFAMSGLTGAFASYLAAPTTISTGASGAVFGLLGALFVELTLHRQRYRAAWKRGMWGGLVVVTVAQVAVGFVYPVIDQWAHGGGLVAGAVMGGVLSYHVRWARAGRHLGRAIAIMFVAFAVTAAVMIVRTSLADSLGADKARTRYVIAKTPRTVGDVVLTAPPGWLAGAELSDPDGIIRLLAVRVKLEMPEVQLAGWTKMIEQPGDKEHAEFETIQRAPVPVVGLPAGFTGVESIGSFSDSMGYRQEFRIVICGKAAGDSVILVRIVTPETVAHATAALLRDLLASIEN
ncbi:MAG: rhomboid family intramembrane serine protease [Kofleriaceae bacterium]